MLTGFEEVIRSITQIKEQLKDLDQEKKLQVISDKELPSLPMKTVEELNEVEAWLAVKENVALLVKVLSVI